MTRYHFDGLDHLQTLILDRNRIASIERGDFAGLHKLHTLRLSGNQITDIESGDFEGLDKLQVLSLGGGPIASIERGDFDGLSRLTILDLSSGQLANIDSGAFRGLVALERLWLSQTAIHRIGTGFFTGLAELQTLYLNNSQIELIERGAFHGLRKLETLWLKGNRFEKLDLSEATFDSLAACDDDMASGFCVKQQGEIVRSLILDNAVLSKSSLSAILEQTSSIFDVSLVDLTFSDGFPANLDELLNIASLHHVTLDLTLFNLYTDELSAFDALPGNTVTVVLPGDTNGDGSVDLADVDNVRNHFGRSGNGILGDTNGDHLVDLVDLNNVRNHFGEGSSAAGNVPEPSAIAMLLVSACGLAAGRACGRRLTLAIAA